MLDCVSEKAVMRDCHESVQSGPPAESSCPSKGTKEFWSTLSSAGRGPRCQLSSQCENSLQKACLARRRPVEPLVGHGPRFELGERGWRQAGREVDREAAVLDPAETTKEKDDDIER